MSTNEISGEYYIENIKIHPDTGKELLTFDFGLFEGYHKGMDPYKTRTRIKVDNVQCQPYQILTWTKLHKQDKRLKVTLRIEEIHDKEPAE